MTTWNKLALSKQPNLQATFNYGVNIKSELLETPKAGVLKLKLLKGQMRA